VTESIWPKPVSRSEPTALSSDLRANFTLAEVGPVFEGVGEGRESLCMCKVEPIGRGEPPGPEWLKGRPKRGLRAMVWLRCVGWEFGRVCGPSFFRGWFAGTPAESAGLRLFGCSNSE
jgi:hypothetical protein